MARLRAVCGLGVAADLHLIRAHGGGMGYGGGWGGGGEEEVLGKMESLLCEMLCLFWSVLFCSTLFCSTLFYSA